MTQETRGKVKKLQGRVKEATGILAGDRKLEQEGAQQRAEGAVQEGLGKAGRKLAAVAKAIQQ